MPPAQQVSRFRIGLLMKILLSEETLRDGIVRMAQRIDASYGDRPLTVVGVMTGSILLLADLMRLLSMPLRVGVVQARSYGADAQRGPLRIDADLLPDVHGQDVLLLDDIFDTGHTLTELRRRFDALSPSSVRAAVLLRKQGCQQVGQVPDFIGFDIPDVFVVGYGLDFRDRYRNLPHVAALTPEEMT
jgi:hypoxanthine phosphoribosyltransferase